MRSPSTLTPRGGNYPTSALPPSKVELLVPDCRASAFAALLTKYRVPASVGHRCSGFAPGVVGCCIAFSCPGDRAVGVAQRAATEMGAPVWLYLGGLEAARIEPEAKS